MTTQLCDRPRVLQIEAGCPGLMAVSPIHTMPHLPTWHAGRVIVIGEPVPHTNRYSVGDNRIDIVIRLRTRTLRSAG